jgi:hypothetical protein
MVEVEAVGRKGRNGAVLDAGREDDEVKTEREESLKTSGTDRRWLAGLGSRIDKEGMTGADGGTDRLGMAAEDEEGGGGCERN